MTAVMKRSTLQQHKEVATLCEEGMTTTKEKECIFSTTKYQKGDINENAK